MTEFQETPTGSDAPSDLISVTVPHPLDCIAERARKTGNPHSWQSRLTAQSADYLSGRDIAASSPLEWGPATIVLPSEGNGVRATVTYRRVIGTFSFLSQKAGRTQTGEGPHELHTAQRLEVLPHVVDYQCQGVGLRWETSAGPRGYISDFIVGFADDTVEAWEVKANWADFHDPEYAEKISYARTALASIGVGFRQVVAEELDRPAVTAFNIARAFNNRFTQILPRDADAVADALARRGGEAPMGEIEDALHPDRRIARAKADALLCRRQLVFSLTAPVIADTPVTAPPALPAGLRDIRSLDL